MRRLSAVVLLSLLGACQSAQPPDRTVIFFNANSIAIDAEAEALVRQAASRAQATPRAPVSVLGFASPAGDSEANRALSRARAENVAATLASAGVPRERIGIRPRGSVPYEDTALESRRVEIVIGQ